MIPIVIADDSALMRHAFRKALENEPGIEIAGEASDGKEAMEKVLALTPKVLVTDIRMPVMDGHELVSHLMETRPLPILVVSSVVDTNISEGETFRVLEAGAMDILPKPDPGKGFDKDTWQRQLVSKIKVLAGVVPITRKKAPLSTRVVPPAPLSYPGSVLPRTRIICIGASTGGPLALKEILSGLPPVFPFPVCCALHISEGFTNELVEWLDSCTRLKVVQARDKDVPVPGLVYFPPDNSHMAFNASGRFRILPGTPSDLHKPCVDTLFETAAAGFGNRVTAVLLTGMGKDGALGLLAVRNAGGHTIAQDEASSVVYGMPGEAVRLGAANRVLSLDRITPYLSGLGEYNPEHR